MSEGRLILNFFKVEKVTGKRTFGVSYRLPCGAKHSLIQGVMYGIRFIKHRGTRLLSRIQYNPIQTTYSFWVRAVLPPSVMVSFRKERLTFLLSALEPGDTENPGVLCPSKASVPEIHFSITPPTHKYIHRATSKDRIEYTLVDILEKIWSQLTNYTKVYSWHFLWKFPLRISVENILLEYSKISKNILQHLRISENIKALTNSKEFKKRNFNESKES